MKKIFLFIFLIVSFVSYGQTYNPANFTVSNKSYGAAQAVPTDARSQYYDAVNFVMRDYQSVSEVNTYLNLPKYRTGHFLIYIHNGGSLSSGVWTGGTTDIYIYKDGVADGDLIPFPTGSGGITGLTGDVTASGTGSVAATIANNAVSNAKFRQSAGLSIVGRTSNSTGNVADITAGTSGHVLRRNGTTLDFGTIDSTSVPALHTESYYNTKYPTIGSDSVYVKKAGTGTSLFYIQVDSLKLKALQAGSNVTLTQNADSSITISAAGGSGSPGGSNTQIQFNNSSAFGGDAGLTYNSTTNTVSTDSVVITRNHYVPYTGLWSERHNQQSDTSVIGSKPYGYFMSGSDGTFRNSDGQIDNVEFNGYNVLSPGNRRNTNEAALWFAHEGHFIAGSGAQFELHWNFISINGLVSYRPFGLDIIKSTGASTGYWRADSWNWFQTGSTLRPMLTLTPTKMEYDIIDPSGYFSVARSTTSDYLRISMDSTNGVIPITHTKPVQFSSSVNIGGTFTTTSTVGSTPVEHGNLTLKSGSSSQLLFAPGNSISYGMGQSWNSAGYGGIGINAPNTLGRGLTSNEGVEFLMDARGVAAPLRIGTITTGGTETFTSFGADGRIAIGQSIQSPPVGLYINFSDAIRIPSGNTGARPTAATAYTRWNTDSARIEVFNGTIWRGLLYNGEATGGGGSGLTSLNGLTTATQTFAINPSGAGFTITSTGSTHTFDPVFAGSGVNGLVSTGAQDFQGVKNFTNKPTGGGTATGQSFEVGTFGISNSGAASLRFAPSNTDNKSGWNVNSAYMTLGINAANTFGNDATNNGAEILFDTRSGVADPFRFFVNKIAASTQAMAINDDAEVKIGSATTQAGFKLQVTGNLYAQGTFRLGGTRVANANDVNLLVKGQSDSLVSQLNFPITQSTYTPTKTDVTNVASSSVTTAYYSREGNKIEVWGEITIDPTATGNTEVDLSLPISSAMSNSYDLSGSAVTYDNNQTFRIYYAGGKAVVRGNASVDASSHVYSYRFVYYYFAP